MQLKKQQFADTQLALVDTDTQAPIAATFSEIEITIPKNPLILNYKGDTDVRGSDIAGGLRQQLKEVYEFVMNH